MNSQFICLLMEVLR